MTLHVAGQCTRERYKGGPFGTKRHCCLDFRLAFLGEGACYENPRLSVDRMSSSIVLTVGSGLVAGMLQSV